MISPERRDQVLHALRKGSVPSNGLDLLAVGLDRFSTVIGEELEYVGRGNGGFKAIRGDYGTGKTFTVRWIEELARQKGFATTEVQISETETPLHKLQTVYRRAMEQLRTATSGPGAVQDIVDQWFYVLETDVIQQDPRLENDEAALERAIAELMEKRLADVSRSAPQFAAALRGYQASFVEGDMATAQGLLAWLGGQPQVGYTVKREAGLKGEVDHASALSFLGGLLAVLRDSGFKGLVFVLDEVETLQRARRDVREKSLNALRQLIDELDRGRFPGMYLIITGTPAFFTGSQGVQRLEPLAQRLATDFDTPPEFDNPRAAQIRLLGFGQEQLVELGRKVRDLFADGSSDPERIRSVCDDAYIEALADALVGQMGGKVNLAPRVFLKKLVADVLDRVEQHPTFDPRQHYKLTVSRTDLSDEEHAILANPAGVDDIALDLTNEDDDGW